MIENPAKRAEIPGMSAIPLRSLPRLALLAVALSCVELPAISRGEEPKPAKSVELSEAQKIERLIGSIESLKDAKFRRNGSDYSAKEAADHLRRKLSAAGDKVKTAEQFIEHLATKSSVSGEAYEIRYADGRVVKTADFLRAELKKLEEAPKGKNAG